MPNWCMNKVTISHNPFEITGLADAMRDGKFCDYMITVPEELKITAGFLGNDEEQRKLEEAEQANLAKWGVKNWYEIGRAHV